MNSKFHFSEIVTEVKYSLKLALPLVAIEVIQGLSGFIATMMAAHLGKEQLAANALTWSIYLAIILFFIGIFCAVGVMSAQSFGANDKLGAGICFKQGIILAIISSIPMTLLMYIMPTILVWTKQDPAVIACAKPLFYALSWTMLPLNLWVVSQEFLSGINQARTAVLMSIVAVPTGIFFIYVFLFGKFGLPKLGLAGIGYGLLINNLVIAISCGSYLYFSRKYAPYALFKKWWVIESKFLIELLKIGLPLGVMFCSELIFFATVAMMMGRLGVNILAAHQIANQYLMIALMVLFGLIQTVMIRVGNEVGRNNRHQLKLSYAVNLGIAFVYTSVFCIFYMAFPEIAISLDIDLHASNFRTVAIEATKLFPIAGILLVTEGFRLITYGSLRGLKDSNFQLLISIIGFWLIAFPTAYLLAFKLGFGGVGVWWGIVIGLSITGIILIARFYRLVEHIDLLSLVTKK